jgi:hypothetical protein
MTVRSSEFVDRDGHGLDFNDEGAPVVLEVFERVYGVLGSSMRWCAWSADPGAASCGCCRRTEGL